jgi:hypothetical protein
MQEKKHSQENPSIIINLTLARAVFLFLSPSRSLARTNNLLFAFVCFA